VAQSKNILVGLVFLLMLIVIGSFGISVIESQDIFSSFYYIVMTITTVGQGGFLPITGYGKIVTVMLLMLGMGTVLYVATSIASALIEGHTRQIFSGLRGGLMRIKKEKDHIIVCGYGKLGQYVADTLKQKKQKYLIIEDNLESANTLLSKNEPILQGSALDPHVLGKANIAHAKAIVGTLKNDADNIYLMMTAQELNPNILCAAKAQDEDAVKRLHKVGAQIVVFPQVVGGRQLANAVILLISQKSMVLLVGFFILNIIFGIVFHETKNLNIMIIAEFVFNICWHSYCQCSRRFGCMGQFQIGTSKRRLPPAERIPVQARWARVISSS